ncbi:hypothetical protein E4U42_005652 [Claviceps africana]|uniref:Uncharacterized protein n=1 Tax=Claviceps africana TaxID=83212 RepID=A0A8K0NJ26_9HYPO|nr:hypothetical protein E4U42_005652 [Claviceps africana]
MASTSDSRDKVTESLSSLTLDTPNDSGNSKPVKSNSKPKRKPKKKVVDSWEDDDESSGSDEELRLPVVTSPVEAPSALPPAPFEATYGSVPSWNHVNDGPMLPRGGDPSKRPEKTDAVARRMIAAGLGLKTPKQTEEQRAYQKSVREQEKKKREMEREEEQRRRQESEMAKAAIWED